MIAFLTLCYSAIVWLIFIKLKLQPWNGKSQAAVVGIGLSGQMHGSVLLASEALANGGTDARALRPALLWNDQRTASQCEVIEQAAGGRETSQPAVQA